VPVHLETHQIIKGPLITEKVSEGTELSNTYGFEVDRRANKVQIKNAVEKLFDVKVIQINTMIRKGKPRRVRANWAKEPSWKRALVRLREGDRIE
jgi:large subunit ribosomal protein L23